MKKLFIFLFATISTAAFSQTVYNGEGGFTGSPEILSADNIVVDQQALNLGTPYTLQVGFSNGSVVSKIPAFTIELHIDLGENLVLNTGFEPRQLSQNMPDKFDWYINNVNGHVVLIARQKFGTHADIAALQSTLLHFVVKAKATGPSTVSGEIRIHNSNSSEKLSDPMLVNNSTMATYTVTSTLPVTFQSFDLVKSGCSITANWQVGQEVNVDRYEVEASLDGRNWKTVASAKANVLSGYAADFAVDNDLQSAGLLVRLKNVDVDGRFSYSNVVKINSLCTEGNKLKLYPNPVLSGNSVNITSTGALLQGSYRFDILDNAGKLLQSTTIICNGVSRVELKLPGSIARGTYHVRSVNTSNHITDYLKFVKM